MTTSEYRAAYRRMRIENGICHDCGGTITNGKSVCDACLEKRKEYYRLHAEHIRERQRDYARRKR